MYNHSTLYNFLQRSAPHWVTASVIESFTGISAIEIRKCANNAPQTFISCGKGYKLARLATASEVENSLRILMSRAEKIMHRARSLQRYSLERNLSSRRRVVASVVSM